MSCNCDDCSESVEALEGPMGNDGTTTSVNTGSLSTEAAVHYMYTANRASTSSDALNYDWTVITIPAVGAANVAIFNAVVQINSIGNNDITVAAVQGGAVVAGIGFIQNCGLREAIPIRFELANVVQGDVIKIRLTSSDLGQTPVLKGANCQIDIWS